MNISKIVSIHVNGMLVISVMCNVTSSINYVVM